VPERPKLLCRRYAEHSRPASQSYSLRCNRKTLSNRAANGGIEHLESLLQSSQDSRRLSAEDRKKLQQEALTNIEKGIEYLDSGTRSSGRAYKALREFYTPGVTVDPKVIQRLIEQLENLNVELVEVRSEEPGEPEIRYIDPEKLPPAYRERIRKYFEKLSEQR